MIKRIYLTLFLCLLNLAYTHAQSVAFWQPKVVETNTQTALETANISINKQIDFPVDNNGHANISLNKVNEGDSIYVSCMGYQTAIIYVANKQDLPKIVTLTSIRYDLNEVVISKNAKKPKETTIGTQAFSISSVGLNYNSSYGLYINNNEQKAGYIKEIGIRMFDRSNGIEMPFKLRLYRKTGDEKFPKEELMAPIILQNLKKKRWFNINISHLAIRLPENGFFIVVEILGKEYYSDKMVRSFGQYVKELPNFGFTTFPKSVNKDNYSIIKLNNNANWFLNRSVEYQLQAKIIEIP